MSAPILLPDGWQGWPAPYKARLLALVGAQAHHDADEWGRLARPPQRPPQGDWFTWLVNAGRGFGKTRTGAEWVWRKAHDLPASRGALVSPTSADTRDVIVEGESGLLAVCPDWFRPTWEPSKRRLTYPNGSIQTTYSADEPDRLRGPQHHYGWVDEWAAMKRGEDMMAMLDLGLRLGQHPQKIVTTTPRPHKWLRAMIADPSTVTTGGSTYDNIDNLAPSFKRAVLERYEGTRLGRQELHAEILSDVEGALWTVGLIERDRIHESPPLGRVVVAIDPAVTAHETSDETGIIVAATILGSAPTEFVVLDDVSGRYTPQGWAEMAARTADKYGADAIVAETNQGGDLVKATLAQAAPWAAYRPVTARDSKRVRAEPVAALYEQGRVHHVGVHALLEDQLTSWVPDRPGAKSPDRLDALVWSITDLANRDTPKVRTVRT